MSFNEWRHRHTNYDNRMRGARSPEQLRAVQEQVAMAGMQHAVAANDRQFAQAVITWAQSKRLVAVN